MEEGKKKTMMIVVIVACLVVAGAITYFRTVGAQEDLEAYAGESVWVVCTNSDCEAQYSMDKQVFYEEATKQTKNPPVLICKDCSEQSIFQALKCEKCGEVFFKSTVKGEGVFPDTCPKCGHSATKAKQEELFGK